MKSDAGDWWPGMTSREVIICWVQTDKQVGKGWGKCIPSGRNSMCKGMVVFNNIIFSGAFVSCCCSVTKSCPTLCDTPWTAARSASLSFTIFQSLLRFMSVESVMLSSHLVLCCPLLFIPSIFSSIRVFSCKSTLCIRWPKYWSFSFRSLCRTVQFTRLLPAHDFILWSFQSPKSISVCSALAWPSCRLPLHPGTTTPVMELQELSAGQSTFTPFPQKPWVTASSPGIHLPCKKPACQEFLTEGNFVIRRKKASVPPPPTLLQLPDVSPCH